MGGDDVVDAVRSQVVVAEFRSCQIGGVAGGVEDDGAAGGAFFQQFRQGIKAAEMIPVLSNCAFAMSVGDQTVAAIRMNHEHAAGLGAEHVGDMGQPLVGIGIHERARKDEKAVTRCGRLRAPGRANAFVGRAVKLACAHLTTLNFVFLCLVMPKVAIDSDKQSRIIGPDFLAGMTCAYLAYLT
ncbi:MAG: hypothetical protein IPJ38_16920 [Dechloromonas sp.]|uniref:Uncharacterized protein n=1 Tax=Candidatus Dechloromonas phosphorivorans TaxID=2899244 RepID=A0A935K1I7_9RHOO|nr:hypothetical protein [Candidatus Dechloromonas phosphorivorans]